MEKNRAKLSMIKSKTKMNEHQKRHQAVGDVTASSRSRRLGCGQVMLFNYRTSRETQINAEPRSLIKREVDRGSGVSPKRGQSVAPFNTESSTVVRTSILLVSTNLYLPFKKINRRATASFRWSQRCYCAVTFR